MAMDPPQGRPQCAVVPPAQLAMRAHQRWDGLLLWVRPVPGRRRAQIVRLNPDHAAAREMPSRRRKVFSPTSGAVRDECEARNPRKNGRSALNG
jgi:hypothetical protein